MSIFIGGDVVPTQSNEVAFCIGDWEKIVDQEIKILLDRSDLTCVNLEAPLFDGIAPIKKCGPNLKAKCDCVRGLKTLGIDLCSLANNHIMDHGDDGLKSTLAQLDKTDIAYTGVDENLSKARVPFYFDIKGKHYGIYACAEH